MARLINSSITPIPASHKPSPDFIRYSFNLSKFRLTKRMPNINASLRQFVGKASKTVQANEKLTGDAMGAAIHTGYSSSKAGSSSREGQVEKSASRSAVTASGYWKDHTFLGTDDAKPVNLPPFDGKTKA
ncbi:hypothetical protein VP01_313g5 [Puccinia sorghi]|uniref:Uncharacterized protein n=1 Tax=Puccinia sorghi TaxID=27349 RepID=A0A0L6V0U9_9BASI|nr:hypothetical protein VP01_313g5 [Puccinia sorghi]